jgi:hypothetical protein
MDVEEISPTSEATDEIRDLDYWLAIDRDLPAGSAGCGWWAFPTPREPRFLIPTDPRTWRAAGDLMSHTRRGRWISRALPWLRRLHLRPAIRAAAGTSPLEEWLGEVTGRASCHLAIYHGTPSVFTKHTVQCQDAGGNPIAYAKIPAGIQAAAAIRNEALALQHLQAALPNEHFFPRLLGLKLGASLQSAPPPAAGPGQASAKAAARSAGVLSASLHQKLPWVDSPVRRVILDTTLLCESAGLAKYASTLAEARTLMDAHWAGQSLRHHFSHGDFLPWNTRECAGMAFAFDWEWAEWRLPFHDSYHFLLMPALGSAMEWNHPGSHLLASLPGGPDFRGELESATGENADQPLWLIAFLADRLAFYVKNCLAAGTNPSNYSSVRDLQRLLSMAMVQATF